MMKWVIKHGLLLCIGSILLIGALAVLFQEKIQITSSTWTVLLLLYFVVLSLYSSYEYRNASVEEKKEETPQNEQLLKN
ncbi:hypothetical protein E1I69_11570 [Bacillus timonensis]|uniref:Uncharacterized protein n=1 Tax=Bacillus timonensis TaxID=1033734 RepID=A0A4S3PSE0_9BACI|nr:hypothetical protein [Bacillus timonensis]THE12334.1 hypothetical protein E1I69_11570 [Bacillus timonensis]